MQEVEGLLHDRHFLDSLNICIAHLEVKSSHPAVTTVQASSGHTSQSGLLQSEHGEWFDTACEIL